MLYHINLDKFTTDDYLNNFFYYLKNKIKSKNYGVNSNEHNNTLDVISMIDSRGSLLTIKINKNVSYFYGVTYHAKIIFNPDILSEEKTTFIEAIKNSYIKAISNPILNTIKNETDTLFNKMLE